MEEFIVTETTLITTDFETTTCEVIETTADLSNLSEVDVGLMNTFFYLGISFILGCLFWFVCKNLYRLLRMFF